MQKLKSLCTDSFEYQFWSSLAAWNVVVLTPKSAVNVACDGRIYDILYLAGEPLLLQFLWNQDNVLDAIIFTIVLCTHSQIL